MNIQKIVTIVACVIAPIGALYPAYDVSFVGGNQWRAEGGYFDEVATLSIPLEGVLSELVWENTDSENPLLDQVIRFIYQPQGGNSTWYDFRSENVFFFTARTGVWTQAIGSDAWMYSAGPKRWTQTAGGSAVWEFSATTGAFVYNPSGAAVLWRWEEDLGVWRHVSSDSTWRYNFVTARWDEITNPDEVALAVKPPVPLVQQMYAMMVMNVFFQAGVVAESGKTDWVVTSGSSGLLTITNSSQDFTATYNTALFLSSLEGRLLGPVVYTQGGVTCSYSHETGDFEWQKTIHPLWREQWTFLSSTGAWTDFQTGATWEYDADNKRWSEEVGDTWQYDTEADRWYKNDDEAIWRYIPATGYWEHTVDAVTWRYRFLLLSSSWLQITTHAGEPEAGLPPLVVVQKTLIDTLYEAVRLSGALEVGVPTDWGVFSFADGVWSATNNTETQSLSYVPHLETLSWQGASHDETFQYILTSGSWMWNNAIDPDDLYSSEYNGMTGEWFENGSDLATWLFDAVAATWSDQETERVWTQQTTHTAWQNSETEVIWNYSLLNGTWTEQAHNSVWKYNTTGRFWKKVSGDGSGVTDASDLPALPLVEQMYIYASVYAVLAQGPEVVHSHRMALTLTPVEGEDDTVVWEQLGNSLTAYLRGSEEPFVEYARDDNAFSWRINPDTGEWSATQGVGEDAVSWSFNPETRLWTGGIDDGDSWSLSGTLHGGTWTHADNELNRWRYEVKTDQWYDVTHGVWWIYDPRLQVWIDAERSAVWRYDWRHTEWQQLFGLVSEDVAAPPLVIVQAAHISGFLDAIAYAGHFSVGPLTGISFEKQDDSTWLGDTESHTFLFSFDSSQESHNLSAFLNTENHSEWLASRVTIMSLINGTWTWSVAVNPFAPQLYIYDSTTHIWSYSTVENGEAWEYDPVACVWTNQDDLTQWRYSRSNGQWTDEQHAVIWEYSQESDTWACLPANSTWRYDGIGHAWTEVTHTGILPHFPPRVVAQSMIIATLARVVIESGALRNTAVFEWGHTQQSWYGVDADAAGIARYDARKTYPIIWADATGRNQASYNPVSGAWKWRLDSVVSSFDPVRHVWKTALRTDDNHWYYSDDEVPTWTRIGDDTETWLQEESGLAWRDVLSDIVWTYDEIGGVWSTDETEWGYHFATNAWYEISVAGTVPERMPPLPLVQQEFLTRIGASIEAFFDQPLYAGARQSVSSFEHPLYGSRPLEKNSYYGRYNSPAVLVNAPVTCENIWLIHSDVSRNLGAVQLPGVTTRALPMIIGGERASLGDQTTGPSITLFDSTLACHESLVASGVRFQVSERPAERIEAFGGVEDNISSLMVYQRGRAYDGRLRRGLVFQLGSAANRMLDGTVTESLQNAYLDIYRTRDTAVTQSDTPTQILFNLDSAPEPGVGAQDRSISTLFMAHDSNIRMGWPSPVASELYVPSTIPLMGIASSDPGAFNPGYFGGGLLGINSTYWCLSGRTTDGMPPRLVTTSDDGAVVYVEYGGGLTVAPGADVIIDTTIAVRTGYDDRAGAVAIPRDQLLITPQGRVQGYGADFVNGGESEGLHAGNVRVSGEHSSLVLGKPFQASSHEPIKCIKRRSRRTK
jgi:hypothetical protein